MIDALTAAPEPTQGRAPVVLMVSGGSDSTALLVRAAEGLLDLRACGAAAGGERGPVDPSRLHVLHVNHCLRGEASDGDEAFVADLARRLGVPCTCRRVDVPALLAAGGNMEENARRARYEAAWELARTLAGRLGMPPAAARVAVAHTADDRAETFLMRAATGAGLGGLCGMRASRGVVVRPLLGQTRAELRAYLRGRGVGWREDATNDEDAALRSYVRHHVAAPLAARNPAFPHTLGAALDVLADEDDLLDRMAARELERMRVPVPCCAAGVLVLDAGAVAACEPALARRALRRALAELLGEEGFRDARVEARHVEALRDLARAGEGSRTLPGRVDARVAAGRLALSLPSDERPVAPADAVLPVPGRAAWGGSVVEARLHPVPPGACAAALARALAGERGAQGMAEGRDFVLADAGTLGLERGGSLSVGAARAGERMRPFGMAGSKLVFDLLAQARVPAAARPTVPVVRGSYAADSGSAAPFSARGQEGAPPVSEACVWVGGIRLDARAAWGPGTRVLIELTFMRDSVSSDGAPRHGASRAVPQGAGPLGSEPSREFQGA